jgi:DNA-binding beta-propeller fold protein YncE
MPLTLPQERVRAPELEGGAGWLNTDRPLSLRALRGKVVLLDFWTYCCINCMHVLADLSRLEAKYPRELVVIGVHSAKFANERETANIRESIRRYGIAHPVVNDREFRIWSAYGVRAWPTLVVIDAAGYVVGGVSGEGHGPLLDQVIGQLVEEARAGGILDESPAVARPEGPPPPGALAFPGKLLADETGGRLFIADTNHHRIVIAALDGRVLDVAGSGSAGMEDGTFATARFNHPQGLALRGDALYVADTDNHLIRRLDPAARTVTTVAGTGEQGRGVGRSGAAQAVPLNSPWDLALADGLVYIAMAGSHQIWVLDPRSGEIGAYAGSGREDIADGPRLEAAFAQPSGITADPRCLYVADSEASGIRAIDRQSDLVVTLVGRGLFEFGDRDGAGEEVRLQHPLGVHASAGILYVADTYNHKVKVLSPATRTVATLAGTGRPGLADGSPSMLYEPGGLWAAGGRLWVADTNNHAVRVADLPTGPLRTLTLSGL